MDTGPKQRTLLSVLIVVLLITVVLYTGAEIYRDTDYEREFVRRKGRLISTNETALEEASGHCLVLVELENDRGLKVRGHLKLPSPAREPIPAILALGGIRTGKRVLDYIEDTHGLAVFALDYPYEGRKSKLGWSEFLAGIPAMRQAVINTVPAAMLGVDYLSGRVDIDHEKITFVGGSVGALFGPAIGAADGRIAAVALLFGAGDIQSLIGANLDAPAPIRAAAGWAGGLLTSPVEPLKYVHRISPRPLFMMNGRGDPRMPIRNSELLHDRAGAPKTVRWIEAGHVNIRSTEFHRTVRDELVAWCLENGLILPQPTAP